jgi:propanediol dehydratase small subunit
MGVIAHDTQDQAAIRTMVTDTTSFTATETVKGVVLKAVVQATAVVAVPAAAPAGGTGATAGAYDTAVNRDAAIATINGLRLDVIELQAVVNGLIDKLQDAGVVSAS